MSFVESAIAKHLFQLGSTSAETCAHDANIDRESDSEDKTEPTNGFIEINVNNGTDADNRSAKIE